MELIPSLLLLVVLARLLGRLFVSLGYLEIIGQILAGLILGPLILNLVPFTHELKGIVELAIFMLIFGAGLEMDLKEVVLALRKKALLGALFGFGLPLLTGVGVGYLFDLPLISSVTIGLCLAITALPVVLTMLESFKLMDKVVGHNIIGVAVFIDFIALLALGVIFGLRDVSEVSFGQVAQKIGITLAAMIGFVVLVYAINQFLRKEFVQVKRSKSLFRSVIDLFGVEGIFGVAILFVLALSFVSELLGLHFIIGAFFGGLLIQKDIMGGDNYNRLQTTLNSFTSGFFTPVFFASIGMQLNLSAFDNVWLLVVIVIAGYSSKFLGSFIGARIGGIGLKESLQMGILLNSRGVLDLVVADLAFKHKDIDESVFSILVILGVVSTILTPIFYKKFVKSDPAPEPSKV